MNQEITFGQVVKERREMLGLTQAELGRRAGCAAITIRKIEADALRPSVQIAEHLAVALGIPEVEYLAFVRLARANREPSPLPTPPPILEEIGLEDLSGRAIRGYQLGERIGSGGYGVVYRAVQATVNREVAIKIILPKYADRPEFIRRFEAEAQLVARLEHPHIVPLYDYWREPGVAYLVMRLLRGGSLVTRLQNGPLAPETILPWLEQICAGLHAAHRAGVIHRDIKPANILLDDEGNAYLADFGIAKITSNGDTSETQEGMVIGSPAYISPEQILVEPVKPQSDVYSLGVMLYELLTGHKPFQGPTPFALIQQHLNEPLPSLAVHLPNLSAALDPIIQRATAKEQVRRYPDLPSLLADFRQALMTTDRRPQTADWQPAIDGGLRSAVGGRELTNPYKGLRAFGEADAADFFGRETLLQELLGRLAESNDLARFLAVVGPSGSGKSSVVRAGLIPTLRQGGLPGSEQWFIVEILPGAHPWEELEAALLRVAVNPPESLLAQLREDERGLVRAVRRILPADETVELALVIDQFEELFTLVADEATRAAFLNSLVTAVLDPRSRLRVVITLRADFTDRPLQYVDFGELLRQRTEFVLPLTPDELEQAISGPAQRAGLTLEPGLTAAISRDVGQEPGALPLLQYALTELFERSIGTNGHSPLLTKQAYQGSGGVLGALARRADELYAELDTAGQEAARQLFLRLVTLGEGTEDTRRRVSRAELEALTSNTTRDGRPETEADTPVSGPRSAVVDNKAVAEVIDTFGKYRLLSFDRDPLTRGPTVEVAHEALLREWGRLREWLDTSRGDVRMQRLLATAAGDWREVGQDASFLLRGTRLDQFAGWAEGTSLALTPNERAFLEASLADRAARWAEEEARRQRELETVQKLAETESRRATEQARAAWRLRWLAVGLAVFLVAAVGAALLALQQTNRAEQETNRAEREARLATARELAASALSNMAADPERSILLALQAVTTTYTLDKTALREAEEALHQVIPASRVRLNLRGHTGDVNSVAFSPDGKRLYTASGDGTVKVWEVRAGQELLTLTGHTDQILSLALNPDGTRLATTSLDQTAKIWDTTTGQELLTLASHTGGAFGVAFSPDGRHLATGSGDGIVKIWDVATGQEQLNLSGHTGVVFGVAFSPDGTKLATCSDDETVKVWDTATGQELLNLTKLSWCYGVAFSPDGTRLVTTHFDRTARVWEAATGKLLSTLTGHTEQVFNVAFSPDGTRLATAGEDRQVIVREVASGRELFRLAGHTESIFGLAFSPDGQLIATGSNDDTAKIWEASPGREWLTLADHTEGVIEVAYSPDGIRLATGSWDDTAKIWDAASGQELLTLSGHTAAVTVIAFNPDGTHLATGSNDQTIRLWDITTGQALLKLTDHTAPIWGLAFSPDGLWLATASEDKTIKIWDAATGQELRTLIGHTDWVEGLAFSPDGTRLVSVSNDKTAILWDSASGKQLLTLTGHTDLVWGVAFSPDGKRIATSSRDGTAKVWDATSGQELLTLSGHTGTPNNVVFSPDGTRLATAGYDKTIRIWDATTGQEMLTLSSPDSVSSVTYSPDGTRLAAAINDGTTRIYVLPIEEVIPLARSRLTRTWTAEECHRFLHQETCPAWP